MVKTAIELEIIFFVAFAEEEALLVSTRLIVSFLDAVLSEVPHRSVWAIEIELLLVKRVVAYFGDVDI